VTAAPAVVTIRRGSVHVARAVYDRYFAGLEAVILLRREDDLHILPVRDAAAGGFLLKRRNSAGDRVITAAEFLRRQGLADEFEGEMAAIWSSQHAALVVPAAFVMQT
jgi:hypothetical protein